MRFLTATRRVSAAAVTLAALMVGACSDDSSTGPANGNFDTEATRAGMAVISNMFDDPVVGSFVVLAPEFGRTYGAVLGGSPASGPAAVPIISQFNRGTTFVYDPAVGDYVASERTGAPSNGVRIVLYEVNPITGAPNADREVGFADLIDEGDADPDGIALRFKVNSEGEVVLDYSVAVRGDDDAGMVDVGGFLTDGGKRLDFDIAVDGQSGPAGDRLDIGFALDVAADDAHVTASVVGLDGDGGESGQIMLEVRSGSETVRVDMEGDDDHVEGTFWVNGRILARASGDPDDPDVTSEDGSELTVGEVLVLLEIIRFSGEIFDLFEDLLEPAEDIIELGFVL